MFGSSFWNFPKTTWWSYVNRQVTHAPDPVSRFFFMNRLAAENDPPGDAD